MSDGSQSSRLTISDPQESAVYICEVNTGLAGYTTYPASHTEVQLIVIKPGNQHNVRRFYNSCRLFFLAMMVKSNLARGLLDISYVKSFEVS